MSRWKKAGLIVVIALVFILIGAGVFGYIFIRSGLPDYHADLELEGLQGEVGVHRNTRGVAFIAATHEADLYMIQGYTHAKERMWQMELQRRVVQGRLSEVLGEDLVQSDRFLKTIGLDRIAERIFEHTSPQVKAIMEHYARGVNLYLEESGPSVEFRLLGFEPEPWTALDCAGIVSLLAFDLGSNWQEEAFRLALAEGIDPLLFEELLPPYAGWETPRVLPSGPTGGSSEDPDLSAALLKLLTETSLDHLYAVPRLGSNSWVISPARSATGTAVLANDPHLGLGLPSIWYENALTLREERCDMDLYGWSVPGSPGVVIGHNRHIAWGFTSIGDSQDLILEERHPDDPYRFKYEGQWYEAEVEEVEIAVSGREEPEKMEIIYTRHGPLISEDPPLSLLWTAYQADASTLDAIIRINSATGWQEFKDALVHFSTPPQAVVYADVAGNIGFRVVGQLPVRKQGQGQMPSPGWEAGSGWEQMIPFEELPEVFNPESGYIAHANNRVESDDYPYVVALDSAPPYRKLRITEVLDEIELISIEDSMRLQTDWYNRYAAERLPLFLKVLEQNSCAMGLIEREALEVLKKWAEEPVNDRDAAGASIYQVLYLNLIEEVFREKMGEELYREYLKRGYLVYNGLEYILEQDESAWLPEGLEAPLLSAYSSAVTELTEQLGDDAEAWRWDRLQTITFKHDLGAAPLIGERLFNRGPYPYGGDYMTVGRARYSLKEPFHANNGAGLRFIAVMDEIIHTRVVIAGGQSGHPLSPHYSDQLETWLAGEYYEVQIPCDCRIEWEVTTRFRPPAGR